MTQKQLKKFLRYNPRTGKFIWIVSRGTKAAGSVAGNRHADGYIYIKIEKKLYRSSRLVWLYVFGKWPDHHIDHKNRNTSDDRLSNLREATRSQNLGNRGLNKNNKSGFKGVVQIGKSFGAYVNKDGVRHWLGCFETATKAHSAYVAKSRELFGEFARAA
jgi:hypothetical protein